MDVHIDVLRLIGDRPSSCAFAPLDLLNIVPQPCVLCSAAFLISARAIQRTKVAVLGAAGGIGQPLSLLLKLNDNISKLALYDPNPVVPGVAVDLSHINTKPKVTGHKADQLAEALAGAQIVVIPAGVPRKPGMSRDDLFNTNASIVATLMDGVAKLVPPFRSMPFFLKLSAPNLHLGM